MDHRLDHLENPSQQTRIDGECISLLEEYESRLAIARRRFDQHPAVRALFYDPIDPITLEAFLIGFAIAGVRMTEPVEGWIGRAAGPTRVAAKLSAMENLLRLREPPLEVREPERVRNLAFGERAD